jgi:hypothetical protein
VVLRLQDGELVDDVRLRPVLEVEVVAQVGLRPLEVDRVDAGGSPAGADVAQGAGLELQDRHHGVGDVGLADQVPAVARDPRHRAEQVLQVVGVVDAELDHRATRALGLRAPGVGGELEPALVREVRLGQGDVSEPTVLDPLLHDAGTAKASRAVPDGHDLAVLLGRVGDGERVLHGSGDRLLGVERLAGLHRLDDQLAVGVVGRRQHDALDLGVREQLLVAAGAGGDPVLGLERMPLRLVPTEAAHEVDDRSPADRVGQDVRPTTGTD